MTGKDPAVRLRSLPVALAIATTFALLATSGVSRAERSAPQERASEAPNVRVTFEVGVADESSPPTVISIVVPGDGSLVTFSSGQRVPIASTTFDTKNSDDGAIVPVSSFSYQSVGLKGRVSARIIAGGSVKIDGHMTDSQIEASGSRVTPTPSQPVVNQTSQDFEVVLESGESLETLSVNGPHRKSFELSVEILD